jgi:putative ABC transport system permease protein
MDGETNVAIVDTDFVTNVLDGNSSLGTTFILNGYEYKVIGIKSADSSVSSALSSDSSSGGTVILPYKNVLKMSVMKNVTSVEVYYSEDTDTTTLEENLSACLNEIFEVTDDTADSAYSISSVESLVETMTSTETLLSAMLGGIASIALLVGGIGIMNMMLVSVSERTKEIGLRKALGAQPYRIQLQFLIESITLSLLGGFIGILLGEITAYVGTVVMGTTFTVSYPAIALGAGFSAAVGIIFGWMPAKRASALNPIDALRSE